MTDEQETVIEATAIEATATTRREENPPGRSPPPEGAPRAREEEPLRWTCLRCGKSHARGGFMGRQHRCLQCGHIEDAVGSAVSPDPAPVGETLEDAILRLRAQSAHLAEITASIEATLRGGAVTRPDPGVAGRELADVMVRLRAQSAHLAQFVASIEAPTDAPSSTEDAPPESLAQASWVILTEPVMDAVLIQPRQAIVMFRGIPQGSVAFRLVMDEDVVLTGVVIEEIRVDGRRVASRTDAWRLRAGVSPWHALELPPGRGGDLVVQVTNPGEHAIAFRARIECRI